MESLKEATSIPKAHGEAVSCSLWDPEGVCCSPKWHELGAFSALRWLKWESDTNAEIEGHGVDWVTQGPKRPLLLEKYSSRVMRSSLTRKGFKQPHQEGLVEKEKIPVVFLNKPLTYSTLFLKTVKLKF